MKIFSALIATVLICYCSSAMAAQNVGSILLRNVILIDPSSPKQQTEVNILIKGNELDSISQDIIPLEEAETTYDARGGVVLGLLSLGEPASFMIMDGNPQENIDVLLDTKTYTLFAIKRGELLRNRLEVITDQTADEKKRSEGGWLAYAAPPLSVPLNYRNSSKWNRFDTKAISGIAAAAMVIDRQNWVDQNGSSEIQVGDLKTFDGGEIRGLRFGGVGTLNFERPWVWTLFAATHAFDKGFDTREDDDFTIFDARLDIPAFKKAGFSIGKQKEPISMERIMSMAYLPQQERSAVSDALLPARNIGLVMSGTLLDDRVSFAMGAFNNWIDKDQPNSFDDNATAYVGRATWVPWQSENESTLLHLGLGYRYSDAEEGAIVRTEPEFNLSPDFISSDHFDADRIDTYQAEASLRSGPFWLHGEWIQTDTDAPTMMDPTVEGYHVTASWALTGGVREYNKRVGIFGRLPIARTVNQNGWGAWEVSTRYSTIDANDGLLEAGDMDIWSAGINWWLTPYFNINLNYRYITLDKDGLDGNSQGFNSRVLLVLE